MTGAAIVSRLDAFVPAALRTMPEARRRARLFVFALLLGAPLGGLLALYLRVIDPHAGAVWWTILAGIASLCVYPVLLRRLARLEGLVALAVQHLAAVIFFACYFYGGARSPFLAWLPAPPLLAVFCLDPAGRWRPRMLSVLAAELALFYLVDALGFVPPERLSLAMLAQVAVVSVLCVGFLGVLMMLRYSRAVAEHEQALRVSEARYRLLAENATDMISRVALDGTRLYASPAALDVFGYAPEELVGRSILELAAEEDRARVRQVFAALSPERASHTWAWRGRRKDGSLLWLETSLKLVCDPSTGAPSEVVAVTRDASHGRQLQEALAGARDEAERANRAKADFLAHMSHELRTPLNAIIGFASIIEQQLLGPVGTAKYAEYAHDILGCGQHLLTLVNDILDFAKMDAGQLQLVEEMIDVGAMIDACVKMLAGNAGSAGVTLAAAVAPGVGMLHADARRLRQILLNLIGNSIKFTRSGGHVAVDARIDEAGRLALRVSDDGSGIAPEDIARVMEPFAQGRAETVGYGEGTGLGLPLAKRLVEMHGGTLTLESAPGRGTAVTILLPAERVA